MIPYPMIPVFMLTTCYLCRKQSNQTCSTLPNSSKIFLTFSKRSATRSPVVAPRGSPGFFEVALFGYDRSRRRSSTASPRLAKLGNFRVDGGHEARSYTLSRLGNRESAQFSLKKEKGFGMFWILLVGWVME